VESVIVKDAGVHIPGIKVGVRPGAFVNVGAGTDAKPLVADTFARWRGRVRYGMGVER